MAMFNPRNDRNRIRWGKITYNLKIKYGRNTSKNLEGSAFKFYQDPYQEQLFPQCYNTLKQRLAQTTSKTRTDP
jgi:hypothetical protein